ncbi:MAG: transposase [Candidatus Kariarchaeaceae archaeon]|jgi:transposase-like protein
MVGRSSYSAQEKADIVLVGLKSSDKISEICRKHNISPISYTRWKKQYILGGLEAMSASKKTDFDEVERENKKLKAIIGELYVELEYVKKKLERGR